MSEVVIRQCRTSDLDGITAIYAQPLAYGNTLQLPYPPSDLWERRLAQRSPHVIYLVAVMAEEIVGQLTLAANENPRRNHVATLGMAVSEAFTGKGIGSKLLAAALELADNWMNIKRVELEVYVENQTAIRLYEKFGFAIEGRCPRYAFKDGEYVDALIMGRINESVC